MSCPRCEIPLGAEVFCPACGFSITDVDQRYGSGFVVLDRIADGAQCLDREDALQIQAQVNAFERDFPHLFLAVYIDALPVGTNLREFGFWLLNRAAVRGIDFSRPNENGLLFCLDLNNRSASLTTGYLLEEYLKPADLQKVLEKATKPFWAGDYKRGIQNSIAGLTQRLRKVGQSIPEPILQPNPIPQAGIPAGLRALREGHQPPSLPDSLEGSQRETPEGI